MCRFAQVRHARVGSIVTHSERAYQRRARMFASLVKGEAGDGMVMGTITGCQYGRKGAPDT